MVLFQDGEVNGLYVMGSFFRVFAPLYVVLFFVPVQAQENSLRVSLDTNRIRIGEQFGAQVRFVFSEEAEITFPLMDSLLPEGILLVKSNGLDTTFADGAKTVSQHIILTSFDPGVYLFPSIKGYVGSDMLYTNPISLMVDLVEVDTTKQKMYGIVSNIEVPYTFLDFMEAYYIHMLLALILVGLVWELVRRYLRSSQRVHLPPSIPPYRWAMEEIDKLEQSNCDFSDGLQAKLFYANLTDIFRGYIERELSISVMEDTSSELLISIRGLPFLDRKVLHILEDFTFRSDLIKFAKQAVVNHQVVEDIDIVRDFVDYVNSHLEAHKLQEEIVEKNETSN